MAPPIQVQSRRRLPRLDRDGYRTLSEFRYLIRRFLEFSQAAARRAGLTPRQHQTLLAVKGFPLSCHPTIGDLAERLGIRHHSAVELVDRLVEAGLLARMPDAADRRRVLLALTETAETRLAELSAIHLEELRSLRPALLQILDQLDEPPPGQGGDRDPFLR
jgi:DNA-binding MarR family transcriptional regulator